jgi:hypothetical protein
MEFKRRHNRRWFQNVVKFLVFGLFTAKAQAQVFPIPSFVSEPVTVGVQNGGIAVMTMLAKSLPLPITGVTWYYNNQPISTGVITANLGVTASSTLTIPNFSSANAGNYKVVVSNNSGSVTSTNATVIVVASVVTNVVGVVSSATGMIKEGFKLQFTAPTGSNVVIEATSDLSHWSPISTNIATTGSVTYTDTVAKVVSSRFYRAKLQ